MSDALNVVEGPLMSGLKAVRFSNTVVCPDGGRGLIHHLFGGPKGQGYHNDQRRIFFVSCPGGTDKPTACGLLRQGGFTPLCLCETRSVAAQDGEILSPYLPEVITKGFGLFLCLGTVITSPKSPGLKFTPLVVRGGNGRMLVQVSPLSYLEPARAGVSSPPLMPQWRIVVTRN